WQFSHPFAAMCGVSFRLMYPDSYGKYFCGFQPVTWQLKHSGSNCLGGFKSTSVCVAWKCGVLSKTAVAFVWQEAHSALPANLPPDGYGVDFIPSPENPSVLSCCWYSYSICKISGESTKRWSSGTR